MIKNRYEPEGTIRSLDIMSEREENANLFAFDERRNY